MCDLYITQYCKDRERTRERELCAMKPGKTSSCKKEASNKNMGNVIIIVCTIISFCILSFVKSTRYSPLSFVQETSHPVLNLQVPATTNQSIAPTIEEDEDEPAVIAKANPTCYESSERSDTCEAEGDIRVQGSNRTIFVNPSSTPQEWKIKPYARKNNPGALSHVHEWSLKPFPDTESPSQCTHTQTAPAILFSIDGYTGNFFHDVTDVLIPLFITSHKFKGKVHLVVSDTKGSWWLNKYSAFFKHLTDYDIMVTATNTTYCFPKIIAGLTFHKELGVPKDMLPDFKMLIKNAYNLERENVRIQTRPRLFIVSRSRSRSIINEKEIVTMAESIGFDIISEEPQISTNVGKFARMINSADVMIGVHGAGLTNMIFLPIGAVVIQVVPFGGLERVSRDCFMDPALEMGLKYLDYVIEKEESSLIEEYAKDDPVLSDPSSVRRQGWDKLSTVYLKQNVKPNVDKLRITLLDALKKLPQAN